MAHSKKGSPDSAILAEIDKNLARCSSCRHFLWKIAGDHLESSIDEGIAGWRYFEDGVWRPTAEHRAQRKQAEARLQDPTLSPLERKEIRRRLKWNRFRRGDSHTGVPASRAELEQVSEIATPLTSSFLIWRVWESCQGWVNPQMKTRSWLSLAQNQGSIRENRSVMPVTCPRDSIEALQLPAKVECPQCDAVNIITSS